MNPFPWARILFLLAAALVLSGCLMAGPDYAQPAMETPAAWNRLDPLSLPDTPATEDSDLSRWWSTLNDPLLSELVEEALRAAPDLRAAQARLRAARARNRVATAGLFPTLNASGTGSRSRSSEETGSGDSRELYKAGFDASWELDVFGGVRRGIEAAEADLEATTAELDDVRVSLTAETALNYIEVRSLQTRLGIARDNLATQSETLQLTDWRAQAGLVSSQDVEQARSNLEQTRAQIPALEKSLAEAEHRLEILLGKNPGALHERLAADIGLPAITEAIAIGIPAETLRRRPDLRAAERTLAAETARVGVAAAARYPAFRLSGSVGLEALTLSALGNSTAVASSLLGGISAPIFDAGKLRNQVEIQDAVRAQAQIAYEQALLNALQEVENALVALFRSQERSAALESAAAATRNAAELARQRYSAGLIDFQSVLDTQRSVLSVEDSLAGAQTDGVLALIRLYKALGGGWTPSGDIPRVDKETP